MADPIKSYRDLEVWRLAVDWTEVIYRTTGRWPADERFGLTSQIRRAAVSVASNIAEAPSEEPRASSCSSSEWRRGLWRKPKPSS